MVSFLPACRLLLSKCNTAHTIVHSCLYLIITVTSERVRWRLKSPASRLYTWPFIQAQFKENIKVPRHWALWGEFTGDRWIPLTKGQWCGKCFPLMASSWHLRRWKLYSERNKMKYIFTHRLQGYCIGRRATACLSARGVIIEGYGDIYRNHTAEKQQKLYQYRTSFESSSDSLDLNRKDHAVARPSIQYRENLPLRPHIELRYLGRKDKIRFLALSY